MLPYFGKRTLKEISPTDLRILCEEIRDRGEPSTALNVRHLVLRRTVSTLLHEAGYNSDWIEKCLAHEQRGVRAVYNKAEYAVQRASMLQAWADMVDRWIEKFK